MRHKLHDVLLHIFLACILALPTTAAASSGDDLLLMVAGMTGNRSGTTLLQANMIGVTQLYTLDAAVVPADRKTGESGVFSYQLLEEKEGKTASNKAGGKAAGAGASNLLGVPASGTPSLALTSSAGGLMVLYAVTDPTAKYVYIALDYTHAMTLAIVKQLNTGLIRVELATNKVEKVAHGCVLAPIPSSYYSVMQSGDRPIQFDGNGNVIFNGYRLANGTISPPAGLKRVSVPTMTVSPLTDDSQMVWFFKTVENDSVAFQSSSLHHNATQLLLWKESSGEIVLSDSPVYYFFKDSYKNVIYKESSAPRDTVTFARSNAAGGIDKAKLPNTPLFAVVGDDGSLYSIDATQPGGQGTAANVLVSTILPYATTPTKTVSVDNVLTLPWTEMPVQISKGYLYFVARVDPGDGFGSRDTITAQRLRGTDRMTIFSDKRYQLYAWRQTGGYEKLYFTAKDRASSSATTYAGVIDTVKLRQGLPAEQYLTMTPVASATGASAQVKDMEVLAPQIPLYDPGYEPIISDVSKGLYAEGITFSKYMNIPSVEANLQFGVRGGAAVPALPTWILSSLYLIPDLNGLGNSTTTPLDPGVCYQATMNADAIRDYWNGSLWDKNSFLPVSIGAACDAPQCSYGVGTAGIYYNTYSSSVNVDVVASESTCAWITQVPSDATWLTATPGGVGSGSATVTASANATTSSRSTTIQVAGHDINIFQYGPAPTCIFTVDPMTIAVPASGGARSIAVTSSDASCAWNADESLDWLTVTSGTYYMGNATATLSIGANTANTARTGTIMVAGKTVTINQDGTVTYPNQIEVTALQADTTGWNTQPAYSRVAAYSKGKCGCIWGNNSFDQTWGPLTAPESLSLNFSYTTVCGINPNGSIGVAVYIIPGTDPTAAGTLGWSGTGGDTYCATSPAHPIPLTGLLAPGQTYYMRVVTQFSPALGVFTLKP